VISGVFAGYLTTARQPALTEVHTVTQTVTQTITKPAEVGIPDVLIKAAKEEGVVVVYAYPGYRPMFEAFEKKFGIKVEATYVGAPEINQRLQAEAEAKVFTIDLWAGTTPFAPTHPLIVEWAMEYTPSRVLYDVEFADYIRKLIPRDEWGKTIPVSLEIIGVSYNVNLLKAEDVDSIYKLIDPKFNGKLICRTPWLGTNLAFAYQSFYSYFNQDWKKWQEYHEGLKRSCGRYEPSWVTLHSAAGSGEFYAAIFSLSQGVWPNLRFTSFKEGLLTFLDTIHGHKYAPHPNAAKLFLEWIISPEGQKVVAETLVPIDPKIEPKREDHKETLLKAKILDGGLYDFVVQQFPAEKLEMWTKKLQEIYR
jgi:iron(III) transport system substrate-binding protein